MLNSSFTSDTVLSENTEVTLQCTADSNPRPLLSIILNTEENTKQISSINGSSLEVSINVTREYDKAEIYCEATGDDPSFSVVSTSYVYIIKCEYKWLK